MTIPKRISCRVGGISTSISDPELTTVDSKHIFVNNEANFSADSLKRKMG